MSFEVTWWERRDSADRDDLAAAAFGWCRAARSEAAVSNARFFWVDSETIVIIAELDSFSAFDRQHTIDFAAAGLRLGDLARPRRTERWTPPVLSEHAGHEVHAVSDALNLP